jgi:carbon monoxide dehydrogenase subunit G
MMRLTVAVTVKAPPPVVWSLVTDIEGSQEIVSAIDRIEVLDRPAAGIRGLKWRETRTIFGRTATETMWITDVDEGSSYTTEAQSHGSIYRTEVRVAAAPEGSRLEMEFSAEATTFGAKVVAALAGWLMARSVRKALRQDLEAVKRAAESRATEIPG